MPNKRMENSIHGLVTLYTVVIGVALSLAVTGVVDVNRGLDSINRVSLLLFVAFVATLFPFFHGALRHLDDAFLENQNSHIRPGALVIDFGLLFLHALTFVVLSQLLKRPADFAWLLIAVLSIDVIWGLFTYHGSSSKSEPSAEARWAILNLFFVLGVLAYLVSQEIYLGAQAEYRKLAYLLAITCVARSALDYVWCRAFYFPR